MDFTWKIIGQKNIINNLIDLKNKIYYQTRLFFLDQTVLVKDLGSEFAKFLNCSYKIVILVQG